jgi:hypothetical protein
MQGMMKPAHPSNVSTPTFNQLPFYDFSMPMYNQEQQAKMAFEVPKVSFKPTGQSAFKQISATSCIKKTINDSSRGFNGIDIHSEINLSSKQSCVEECTKG